MKNIFVVTNLTLTVKDTEYSITLPVAVQSYTIKARGNTEFKIAYKKDAIAAGNYMTFPSGSAEQEDGLNSPDPLIIYVSGEKAGEILEIKYGV